MGSSFLSLSLSLSLFLSFSLSICFVSFYFHRSSGRSSVSVALAAFNYFSREQIPSSSRSRFAFLIFFFFVFLFHFLLLLGFSFFSFLFFTPFRLPRELLRRRATPFERGLLLTPSPSPLLSIRTAESRVVSRFYLHALTWSRAIFEGRNEITLFRDLSGRRGSGRISFRLKRISRWKNDIYRPGLDNSDYAHHLETHLRFHGFHETIRNNKVSPIFVRHKNAKKEKEERKKKERERELALSISLLSSFRKFTREANRLIVDSTESARDPPLLPPIHR